MLKTYNVAKAAAKLKCHPNTLKRLEKKLNLRVLRDYKNYRIYSEDVIRTIKDYIETVR